MAKSRSSSSKSSSGSRSRSGARSGSSGSKSSGGKSSTRAGSRAGAGRSAASRFGATRSRTARTSATASRSSGARSKSGGTSKSAGRSGGGRATSKVTTDHEEIRRGAEARGGRPACVRGTEAQDETCLLRIDFPGYTGDETLEPISWDEFFRVFDKRKLALVFQETTADGKRSNFNELVDRNKATSGRAK
jgi:hypothetical protein